jgi:hypothetical protein
MTTYEKTGSGGGLGPSSAQAYLDLIIGLAKHDLVSAERAAMSDLLQRHKDRRLRLCTSHLALGFPCAWASPSSFRVPPMAAAEIHFRMVNGDKHVLTIPEGADVDGGVRNARDDPGQWIAVDDHTWIRRENVISLRLDHDVSDPGVTLLG